MADPVSIPAGVAGLLSLGIQVSESLIKYYADYKDQDITIRRTTERIETLLVILQSVDGAIKNRADNDLSDAIQQSINNCNDAVAELTEEYQKFAPHVSGSKSTIKGAGRRLAYPFRQSTLHKLGENISEMRDNISVALGALQLNDHGELHVGITEIKRFLQSIQSEQVSSQIREWLKAPDATIDHNSASAKSSKGTGLWLIQSTQFTDWIAQGNSFLWLNGFAGCGKSVLCSIATQHILQQRVQGVGVAFFYFTFREKSKLDESAMIRAMLLQLSAQHQECAADLARVYNSHKLGTAPTHTLIEALQCMFKRFQQIYVLVDALDECPKYVKRDRVLEVLSGMRQWGLPGLHLLVTSRDESDIRRALDPKRDEDIALRGNSGVDDDINSFIKSQLKSNSHLRKWQSYENEIQQALARRAQGVFRYVECQLNALGQCPYSTKRHLDRLLQSLPRDLDETYERILCGIDEDYVEDTRRVLNLLCFATKPLRFDELIHACTIDLTTFTLDADRLSDMHNIDKICVGLVEINGDLVGAKWSYDSVFQIAHFSVQEYLESDRIKRQKAAVFALPREDGHAFLAKVCLAYLLQPSLPQVYRDYSLNKMPFAGYAAQFWHSHYQRSGSMKTRLDTLIIKMFESEDALNTCMGIYGIDLWHQSWMHGKKVASPVYYASFLGLENVLQHIISSEKDNSKRKSMVNALGGDLWSPLIAASWNGFTPIVQLLLAAGADIDNPNTDCGNPLHAACRQSREEVVELLLDSGADVNAISGIMETALRAAVSGGHEGIVKRLLDAGAKLDFDDEFEGSPRSESYGSALFYAVVCDQHDVAKLLINAGANTTRHWRLTKYLDECRGKN
ncbi:hypothetical protein BJX63DRAFT_412986 [Aspergillus granulosus]|uniref:NACHT domain-containing protein n=1 Tax=Aspergillus granulosus TaxID=176169 RepID=A0ABR4GVQ5_9EURO